MANTIALFSGQGAQYPGMGKELYDNFAAVREIYECAGDVFGFDVAALSFTGEAGQLAKTEAAQPAIFTLSVSAYTAALEEMEQPTAAAGHSLGEYAALYAGGACSLEEMMMILKARATGMGVAARQNEGVMYAIVGLDAQAVIAACAEAGGAVWPVNFNLPTQTVIAGAKTDCAKAAALLEAQGAKAVALEVEGAFHTPLMEPAVETLHNAAGHCTFSPLELAFYSNLTGGLLNVEDYPEYFVSHMLSPVQFVQQMQAVAADGYDTCIEFGPKRVSTLAKKNNRGFTALNVEDMTTLKKAQEALAGR